MLKAQEKTISFKEDGTFIPVLTSRFGGMVILRELNQAQEAELFYDDEERDADAPNPDLQTEFKLPEPFEFDPAIQDADD